MMWEIWPMMTEITSRTWRKMETTDLLDYYNFTVSGDPRKFGAPCYITVLSLSQRTEEPLPSLVTYCLSSATTRQLNAIHNGDIWIFIDFQSAVNCGIFTHFHSPIGRQVGAGFVFFVTEPLSAWKTDPESCNICCSGGRIVHNLPFISLLVFIYKHIFFIHEYQHDNNFFASVMLRPAMWHAANAKACQTGLNEYSNVFFGPRDKLTYEH